MSTQALRGEEVHTGSATVRPYLLGGMAALSVGAAAIHFAVVFEHFADYTLYGVFFLVISWAQMIWPVVLLWRQSRLWLWLGIAGNAMVIAVYVASRHIGLPFGPDFNHSESVGALDVMSCILEVGLIAGCAALLWQPSLLDRPVALRGGIARAATLLAVPVAVIAATTAVMTPDWAGPEGPAGMASQTSSGMTSESASSAVNSGMGDMGTTDGHPDMQMYGSTAPPTAGQVLAAAQLIRETDTSLNRYTNVQAAFAAGYTYVLKTNGEEHLLYNRDDPSYQGLNPQDPRHWFTRSTCRIMPRFCSVPCTPWVISKTGRRSAENLPDGTRTWSPVSTASRPSPALASNFGTAATRPRGETTTPRRCSTYGSWPIPAASSPTTSARPRPTPPSKPRWPLTTNSAPRDVRNYRVASARS
jgi:hypothetical protein